MTTIKLATGRTYTVNGITRTIRRLTDTRVLYSSTAPTGRKRQGECAVATFRRWAARGSDA